MGEYIAKQILKCDHNCPHTDPAGLIHYSVTKASAMSPALVKACIALDELLPSSILLEAKGDCIIIKDLAGKKYAIPRVIQNE